MKSSDRLRRHFARRARRGMRDVRFSLDRENGDLETICSEVLELVAAVAQGRSTPLNFGDTQRVTEDMMAG